MYCYNNSANQMPCSPNFPIGQYVNKSDPSTFYVYNHLDFVITYQSGADKIEEEETSGRIIAIRIYVNRSVATDYSLP